MNWFLVLICLLQRSSLPSTASNNDSRPEIAFQFAHRDSVYCLAYSPDGNIVATGSSDSTIKLWNAHRRELQHTMTVPGEVVYSLAFSSDSRRLVTASSNGHREEPARSHALLWDTATGKRIRDLGSPEDDFLYAAYAPDGKTIAITTRKWDASNLSVNLFDGKTGEPLHHLEIPGHFVASIAFSPDGSILAGAFDTEPTLGGNTKSDAGIAFWDVRSGSLLHRSSEPIQTVTNMAFSPDGSMLATVCGAMDQPGEVVLWDRKTGSRKRTFSRDKTWVNAIAFSPDSKTLACLHNTIPPPRSGLDAASNPLSLYTGSAVLWDIATGEAVQTLKGQGWMSPLRFSSDGSLLFTETIQGVPDKDLGRVHVLAQWNAKTGALLHTTSFESVWGANQVVCSPDGTTLAVSGGLEGSLTWFDAHKLTLLTTVPGWRDRAMPLAFSSDGTHLTFLDSRGQAFRFWNVHTGRLDRNLLLSVDHELWNGFDLSPDNHTLATIALPDYSSGDSGSLHLWDLPSEQHRSRLNVNVNQERPVYHPDTKTRTVEMVSAPVMWHTMAFSPDGKTLVSGGKGSSVREFGPRAEGKNGLAWWNVATGTLKIMPPEETEEVFAVAFSSNGKLVASAGMFEIMLWDALSAKQISRMPTLFEGGAPAEPYRDARSRALAFTPDSKTLAVGDTGIVRLWNIATGSETGQLKGHTGVIHMLSYAPDGSALASAGQDGTVRIWDLKSATPRFVLPHDRPVLSVAYSPDGKLLASGSSDGSLHLWNSRTGKLLVTLQCFPTHDKGAPDAWIAYTPEGYYDGSHNIKDFLRWRVGDTLSPAATYERTYHRPDRIQAALQLK